MKEKAPDNTYRVTEVNGNFLKEYINWLISVYTSYDEDVVTYDAERRKFNEYASYRAPIMLFGGPPPEDEFAPA